MLLGKGAGALHCQGVHAIHPDPGYVIAARVEFGVLGGAPRACSHAELIVFNREHHGDVPQGRQVVRLCTDDAAMLSLMTSCTGTRCTACSLIAGCRVNVNDWELHETRQF